MQEFLTLDDLSFAGKTVLLRADLNVPMKNGKVTDTERLQRLQPTMRDLSKAGAKIVILSHFGRPEGQPNAKYSLRPVADALADIYGQPVAFAEDCVGDMAKSAIQALQPGKVLVLENTRFHAGEEKNDPAFAKALSALGDVFVNDAFSAAHRAHASTEGLAHLLPAVAGRLMQAELEALNKALGQPQRPLAALVGGSKISTKLDLLNNLVSKVDVLVLGGGMANTFLAADGYAVGKSLYESNMLDTARSIAAQAKLRGCALVLPTDVIVASELKDGTPTERATIQNVPQDKMILDLGPDSAKAIVEKLSTCKTVVWNGPLGAFEILPFDRATVDVAKGVASLTQKGTILSVAGGGDTVAALSHAGIARQVSYLSTAGGAFLEWLEGKDLPGVAALRQAAQKAA
ncbi:MAG: phosphoglycerate kinase [Alphaproteobacteria bacterium]|nr:phosphoglycerate kinase [Alphaproteobacteria bacterium]MBV8548901.1 phosphoglycerate kinase [Alphaproteobacteria bacterium]